MHFFLQNIPIIPLPRTIFQLKKLQKINKLKFYFLFLFKKNMGVWSGVISLPRPDLPDTLSITVRLHRDDRFYSPTRRVSICNHQLADLGRAQVRPRFGKYPQPERKTCDP